MDRITGIYKDTGIIEILDSDIYEKLLKIESIYINDVPIEICRYININTNTINNKSNKTNKLNY